MNLRRLLTTIQYSVIIVFSFSQQLWAEIPIKSLPPVNYSYTVSMENPNRHYYHVELKCENQTDDFIDFKMPVWTPGYYFVQNLSKNMFGFNATNESGKALKFTKTSKNTWRVNTSNEETVIINYEVYANSLSVVESYLDITKGFISPTGVYLYPYGKIDQAVKVTFNLPPSWNSITTGLDEVSDLNHSYYAANFNILFDSPVLLGNHKELAFDVKGIPHVFAFGAKDTLDKANFINDLTKIIESATDIIGDIPYTHYAFITIGSPGGGMEHSNSCALSCKGSVADTTDIKAYKRWLSFVAHEYFHLYNVKSIRPIELGPFNYDAECYTNMLWFSEGGTVYYENIILNKARIFSKEDCFQQFSESIANFENKPGHLFQSAELSSFDAWIHYFDHSGDDFNNTISYYDKGCALALLLDLKIRDASNNQKSLDDVMRSLYSTYFKELKRGFTDVEFQQMCELIAGTSLTEIFEYAATITPIDYSKYLNLAGLDIDTISSANQTSAFLGASIQLVNENYITKRVEYNSPAWNAGIGNDITVLEIDDIKVDRDVFDSIMATKLPDDDLHLKISVDQTNFDVSIQLTAKEEKTFDIKENINAIEKEKSILNSWLK